MHKISANRTEKQIYLHFPEVQPNFCVRVAYTKDSANREKRRLWIYSTIPRYYPSSRAALPTSIAVATTIWQRKFAAIGHGNTVSSEREAPQGLPANKSNQILFSAWIDLSVLSTMCKLIDNPQMENKVHLYCYCTAASSCIIFSTPGQPLMALTKLPLRS